MSIIDSPTDISVPQFVLPQATVQRGENDGGLEIYLFYCKEEEQHTHIGFKNGEGWTIAVYSLEDMKCEVHSPSVDSILDYFMTKYSDHSVGLEVTYTATRIF